MSEDHIEERMRNATIGELDSPTIVVEDYDPAWPESFRREEERIRTALGEAAH